MPRQLSSRALAGARAFSSVGCPAASLDEALAAETARLVAQRIAAVEARGFILGGAVAFATHTPFANVRKKGERPCRALNADYALIRDVAG